MANVSLGIVGLPNVGKSTLFNALTKAGVDAANYPFCTIDPNTGVVPLYDERLYQLAKLSGSKKTIAATVSFTDIAGLVKGASKGEGLGNAFLTNIRDTQAIVHMVRCFEDDDIAHVHGRVDPVADVEIIETELLLADLDTVQQAIEKQMKKQKSGKAEDKARLAALQAIEAPLSAMTPLRHVLDTVDATVIHTYGFLTAKRMIYVANVGEPDVVTGNAYQEQLIAHAKKTGDRVVTLCAGLESEAAALDWADQQDYLAEFGLQQSGLMQLAHVGFELLGLQTYLTTGPEESRAWVIPVGCLAPQAAGVIHTDFEKGFIRANVIQYTELIDAGSLKNAKALGVLRQEGKEYMMQDGDVVEFLFNV